MIQSMNLPLADEFAEPFGGWDGLRSELHARGIDTGLDATSGVRLVDGWRLYANAKGQRFAVSEKSWYDFDCREASPTSVPVDEIWRFFSIISNKHLAFSVGIK